MRRFFIADTHFRHENVIKYDQRPFNNVQEMENKLIENWNKVVSKDDLIYHLGDFSFCNLVDSSLILRELNGYKILIRGNHDRSTKSCWAMGWDCVQDYAMVQIGSHLVVLTHDPAHVHQWDGFVLHGHTHKTSTHKKYFCVSCNLHDYAPVTEGTLLKWVNGKPIP